MSSSDCLEEAPREPCACEGSDDEIQEAAAKRRRRRIRKRPEAKLRGRPEIVAVVADTCSSEHGVLASLVEPALAASGTERPEATSRFLLIGVLLVSWVLQPLGTAANSDARVGAVKWLGTFHPKRQYARELAEVHYIALDAAICTATAFDEHVVVDGGVPRACSSAGAMCRATLDFAAFFIQNSGPVRDFFFCSLGVGLLLAARKWDCVSWVPSQLRHRAGHRPLQLGPTGADVDSFIKQQRERDGCGKVDDIFVIHARKSQRKWRTDPRHIFRYCEASLRVRDFRKIADVAEGLVKCMWPEKAQDMLNALYADGFTHPGRNVLLRARVRLDFTAMLLSRRWFQSKCWQSQPRRSIHLQVDASPITGREVFGMIWDVYCGESSWLLQLMPLVLLGYGYTTCLDKTMSLLFSMWLACGGDQFGVLEDLLLQVRSMTTDMGVESGIPDMENVLGGFASANNRKTSDSFRLYPRLFPRCVHIHDWHHLWAGVLKCSFGADTNWPGDLNKLRDLCKFFHWADYRDACASYLASKGVVNKYLKSFTASFAHWRYEALCDVFDQLGSLRPFMENDFLHGYVRWHQRQASSHRSHREGQALLAVRNVGQAFHQGCGQAPAMGLSLQLSRRTVSLA